ncbi:MAG: response regulator [Prochloraceae cyanobacterium]|nr:response regulator [Prochloraceae cyanobacterium]
MSINIDSETLAQITQEARECFLTEDAPEYLQSLESGIQQGKDDLDITEMMRAAHSLKGGAGLAELPGIRELSHQMENLLEGFKKGSIARSPEAWELIERSTIELAFLLSQAEANQQIEADPDLLKALGTFSQSDLTQTNLESIPNPDGKQKLLATLLNKDLEETFIKIENLPLSTSEEEIEEALENFCDECLFIGDTLELSWLIVTVEGLKEALKELKAKAGLDLTREVIGNLREQREEHLSGKAAQKPEIKQPKKDKFAEILLNNDLEESFIQIEELSPEAAREEIKENLATFCDECLFIGDTLDLSWLIETTESLQQALEELEPQSGLELTREVIENLRKQRQEYLGESDSQEIEPEEFDEQIIKDNLEKSFIEIKELSLTAPAERIKENIINFCDRGLQFGNFFKLDWLVETVTTLKTSLDNLEPEISLELARETIDNLQEQLPGYFSQIEVSEPEIEVKKQNSELVKILLTKDLEESFLRVEQLSLEAPTGEITEVLTAFCDRGLFVGDTLELPWLIQTIESLREVLKDLEPKAGLGLAKETVVSLREQRQKYLEELSPKKRKVDQLAINLLQNDLEESFTKIEKLPDEIPQKEIKKHLENFCDECLFIGDTLELPWLVENIESLQTRLSKSFDREALILAKEAIAFLRNKRDNYLNISPEKVDRSTITAVISAPPEETNQKPAAEPAKELDLEPKKKQILSHLRVPLNQLETMGDRVGEMILVKERLRLQQQLLQQANVRIRQLSRRFEPIREQVQATYDWLAIEPRKRDVFDNENLLSDRSNGNRSPLQLENMELDRFTGLHISLQNFQELMLRIQETRIDLDLIERELAEDLDQVDKNLSSLYKNVTQLRLVPFKLFAKRFIPQVKRLERVFQDKSVNLTIKGEDTLADQLLLEQLQTPLTHLLNNAFDHGIEPITDRLARDKSKTAQIILEAKVENSQLTIELGDDGKGIDLEKVYQKAIERGLCDPNQPIDRLTEQQIIDFIFRPDFSTAQQVSEISGRGMGLNIVRDQIRRLGGNLNLETKLGRGTKFIIKLPLDLSLISLLIVQVQEQLLALPSTDILETLLLSELKIVEQEYPSVIWHQKEIPLFNLFELLPYSRRQIQPSRSKIAVILATSFGHIATTVDSLVSEAELIVKPFDNTIPTPTYLVGCTILGTGQVVPVILPQALEEPSTRISSSQQAETKPVIVRNPTILVAEDSVGNRRFLERLLTQVGFDVILCRDGQEALDKLPQLEGNIDLIISDVEMPRLNGFELLYWLRSKPAWAEVPVVMATSRTAERHQQQAKELGANGYLGKPVQPQELFTTIESLLAFEDD